YVGVRSGGGVPGGAFERLEPRTLLSASHTDSVVQWNDVLLDALRHETVHKGPTWASRNAAIVQLAVADAVANVTHAYEPLLAQVRAPRHASLDAAIAGAAHDALVALFPNQSATFDAALDH